MLLRVQCVALLSKWHRQIFATSIFRRRISHLSFVIPTGVWLKNRYLVQCQRSDIGTSDGSKLLYYHDTLERLRRKRRNFVVAVIYGMLRLVRITFRIVQLLLVYTPLLIAYLFVRRNEARLQQWRLWALWFVERSGPAFIKFAQWAGTRRDLFSKEFCDLFSQLHTSTSPHPWRRTEQALKQALGPNWRGFFLELDEKCCGSGCVAQVHKARLNYIAIHHAPSEIRSRFESSDMPWVDVAIKVTHPGIRQRIADDMVVLTFFTSVAQVFIPKVRYLDPMKCLKEFHAALIRQLDMRYEGDALRIFTQQFENDESVHFPKPLFRTEDILIETFEPGEHIAAYIPSTDTELKRKLAKMGMGALLKMVFVNNFVHGDLHPGNILVQDHVFEKPRRGIWRRLARFMRNVVNPSEISYVDDFETQRRLRLVFLDAGISIRLSDGDLKNFRAVFKAVVEGDGAKAADLMLRYAPQQRCHDPEAFKKDLAALVSRAESSTVSLGTMDVSSLLSDLLSTVSKHRVNLEPNFSCVVLAVIVLEGLGRSLYPQLDLVQEARPVLLSLG